MNHQSDMISSFHRKLPLINYNNASGKILTIWLKMTYGQWPVHQARVIADHTSLWLTNNWTYLINNHGISRYEPRILHILGLTVNTTTNINANNRKLYKPSQSRVDLQIFHGLPVSTKHLYKICATSVQRLRRWADVAQMLYKCFAFTGLTLVLLNCLLQFFVLWIWSC